MRKLNGQIPVEQEGTGHKSRAVPHLGQEGTACSLIVIIFQFMTVCFIIVLYNLYIESNDHLAASAK